MRNFIFGFVWPIALFGQVAAADPVVEKGQKTEVNWGTLEVRYFGDAAPAPEDGDSFKQTERRAWNDGVAAIEETLALLGAGRIGVAVSAPKNAARLVKGSTRSRSTTFFGDGKVRVFLNTPLPKVVEAALGEVQFRGNSTEKELATTGDSNDAPTGIIFESESASEPMAVYRLTDSQGETLFGLEDMSAGGFSTSLMGRWFRKPNSNEVAAYVGSNPLRIKAKIDKSASRVQIDPAAWKQGGNHLAALMAAGRVVIAVP